MQNRRIMGIGRVNLVDQAGRLHTARPGETGRLRLAPGSQARLRTDAADRPLRVLDVRPRAARRCVSRTEFAGRPRMALRVARTASCSTSTAPAPRSTSTTRRLQVPAHDPARRRPDDRAVHPAAPAAASPARRWLMARAGCRREDWHRPPRSAPRVCAYHRSRIGGGSCWSSRSAWSARPVALARRYLSRDSSTRAARPRRSRR